MLFLSAVAGVLGGSGRSRVVTPLSLIALVVPANARALETTDEAVRRRASVTKMASPSDPPICTTVF